MKVTTRDGPVPAQVCSGAQVMPRFELPASDICYTYACSTPVSHVIGQIFRSKLIVHSLDQLTKFYNIYGD